MADFVREDLVVGPDRSLRPSDRPVGGDDAVVDRGGAFDVAGVEGKGRAVATVGGVDHPDVEVHRGVPLDQLLQGEVAAVVGQVALDALDARGRLSVGVEVGQLELHTDVAHESGEIGMDVAELGVGGGEVLIELHDRLVDLRVGDVLRPTVMHHVEDDGNEDVPVGAGHTLDVEGAGMVLERGVLEVLHPHPLGVLPVHLLALVPVSTTVLRLRPLRGEQQEQQGQEKAGNGRQGGRKDTEK